MLLPDWLSDITPDVKGAIIGGAITFVSERGGIVKRIASGVVGVLLAMTATDGVVSLLGKFAGIPASPDILKLVAALLAISGVPMVEIIQRFFRRLAGRSEGIADGVADKITGKKDDR